MECPSCGENKYTCECYKANKQGKRQKFSLLYECFHDNGCIAKQNDLDGKEVCADGSDEPVQDTTYCFNCKLEVYSIDESDCSVERPCSSSACYEALSHRYLAKKDCDITELICYNTLASRDYCLQSSIDRCWPKIDPIFQCDNGDLIATSHFCDGDLQFTDHSDKTRLRLGFKCKQSLNECVILQPNLYDDLRIVTTGSI